MCNEDMRIKLDKSATWPNQPECAQPSKKKASDENEHRGTKKSHRKTLGINIKMKVKMNKYEESVRKPQRKDLN